MDGPRAGSPRSLPDDCDLQAGWVCIGLSTLPEFGV